MLQGMPPAAPAAQPPRLRAASIPAQLPVQHSAAIPSFPSIILSYQHRQALSSVQVDKPRRPPKMFGQYGLRMEQAPPAGSRTCLFPPKCCACPGADTARQRFCSGQYASTPDTLKVRMNRVPCARSPEPYCPSARPACAFRSTIPSPGHIFAQIMQQSARRARLLGRDPKQGLRRPTRSFPCCSCLCTLRLPRRSWI